MNNKTQVTVTLFVNASPQEAWDLIDEWVGRTAPAEVDSVGVHVEEEVQPCDHNWIPIRNEIVKSGELCTKCHAVRAEE